MTGGGPIRQDPVERGYRRWLRAYPAQYRRTRGDEILATLLDVATPGRSRPVPGEVLALVCCGLAERVRCAGRRVTGAWSRPRRGRSAAVLALVLATTMSIAVFIAPTTIGYSGAGSDDLFGGPLVLDCRPHVGLLLSHGLRALWWLIPAPLMALIGVLIRRPWAAGLGALGTTSLVVLLANSLGSYYLAAAVAGWLAVAWRDPAADPAADPAQDPSGVPAGEPAERRRGSAAGS